MGEKITNIYFLIKKNTQLTCKLRMLLPGLDLGSWAHLITTEFQEAPTMYM